MADWSSFAQGAAGSAANIGFNAVGSLVNGLIDNLFYKRNLNLQVQAQKDLIDYQNEYNSPSAQMERLSAAGLNPHLIYGSAAPAGQSGNAAAPAGHAPEGYNTADVVRNMLQMQEMKQSESNINLQDAKAEEARANARYTLGMADRYNELVDVQINEANQRIEESASRMKLNDSSIQLQTAHRLLANAEEEYRRGEIDLQQFKKQNIIAQTALYTAQKDLIRTQDYYADVSGQIDMLELLYQKAYYDAHGGIKQLAESERKLTNDRLRYEAEKIAATIGIEGNKVTQWTDWVLTEIGKGLGGAGMAMFGASQVSRARPVHKVRGFGG